MSKLLTLLLTLVISTSTMSQTFSEDTIGKYNEQARGQMGMAIMFGTITVIGYKDIIHVTMWSPVTTAFVVAYIINRRKVKKIKQRWTWKEK
jgi:hypothetical protein